MVVDWELVLMWIVGCATAFFVYIAIYENDYQIRKEKRFKEAMDNYYGLLSKQRK